MYLPIFLSIFGDVWIGVREKFVGDKMMSRIVKKVENHWLITEK